MLRKPIPSGFQVAPVEHNPQTAVIVDDAQLFAGASLVLTFVSIRRVIAGGGIGHGGQISSSVGK